jgi:hypothetical protein
MEPRINHGGLVGAEPGLQERCHQGIGVPEALQRRKIRRE